MADEKIDIPNGVLGLYSGGPVPGGPSTPVQQMPPPKMLIDLFASRNYARYLVDPNGARMEMIFDLAGRKVAVKTGDSVSEFEFIKL